MSQESPNYQNKLIRSFGRIKSRKLSEHKKFLLEKIYPQYEAKKEWTTDALCGQLSAILEIGFGFGDFLFEKAKNNPQKNFYGFEPHLNGVVNILAKLEKNPLENIQISTEDVRLALSHFPDEFFDEIYILFPDPWPKLKHFKRRLINMDFLDNLLAPKLKNGAKLVIATDHDSYKTWILAEVLRAKKILWTAESKKDWKNFPSDWIETKYQKKAVAEGRMPVIFELVKI